MATLLTNKNLEKEGRGGDKVLAHLQPGEVVIPKIIAEDEGYRIITKTIFEEYKANFQEFVVGSGKNKVNPETGYLEFFKNPFDRTPKPSLEQQLTQTVASKGLGPTTQTFLDIQKKFKEKRGGGIFSRGILALSNKAVEILGQMTPIPIPQNINISAQRKSEDIRRTRSRKGRRGTILTEGGLGVVGIGKSTLLGGS